MDLETVLEMVLGTVRETARETELVLGLHSGRN